MPPSLIEIGRRLGYASRYDSRHDFLGKFPELCQAILDRRAAYRAKHRNGLRVKLKLILLEDPPPTLNEVTKRLGYKDSTSLVKYYPKLCRVIVKRHAEYRKVQFKAMRHKLAAILHEESPSSLREAARRWVTTPVILVSNSLMSVKPSPNVMLRSERGSALKGRKSRRRGSGPLLYISTRSAGTLPESESKRC